MRLCALILAALAASTFDWSGSVHAAPAAASEQRLDRITIRSEGQGSPVVLIPGLASAPSVYNGLTPELAPGHRIILVQINGFAGAPPATGSPDGLLPGAIDELAGWLAANHVEKPAIVGHSMGGLMAMMLAKRHPAAAGKLMIVDSLPFYGMLFGPTATPDAIRPVVERMRDGLVSGTSPPQVPPHMSNSEAGKAKILEWLRASDPKTVGEALVEDATTDFRPDLPALKGTPVTVLYAVPSAERAAITKALYADAYKALPQAKLVPVENSEHFIMLDQPRAFAAAVAGFLR
jgi:pimeloyl-ACP methyl ester carboxylesterase